MYAITGIAGHVGSVTANLLLEKAACKGCPTQSYEGGGEWHDYQGLETAFRNVSKMHWLPQ